MSGLRGLTVVLTTADPERIGAAAAIAAASAALGAETRLFLHDMAVAALGSDALATALDLGVSVIACQGGLARTGMTLADADPRVEAGGLVSLLAALGEQRLVTL